MTYAEEIDKLRSLFKSNNDFYSSELYRNEYPRLQKMYIEEGLATKRKNLLRNRKRLKEDGMNALFAVK